MDIQATEQKNSKGFLANLKQVIIDKFVLEDKSAYQIAKEVGCSKPSILKYLRKWGFDTSKKRKGKPNDKLKDMKDEIIKKFNVDNKSIMKISKELSIDKGTISKYLKIWGFDSTKNLTWDSDNLLKDKTDDVLKLYNSGLSIRKISKKIGHGKSNISQILNRYNIKTSIDKYQVDETFFEEINNSDKAYILGFFFADGCVTDKGCVTISLQERDGYIVRWIKNKMQYSGPLKLRRRNAPWQNMVGLFIWRKKICNDLIKLGCMPRKTFKLKFPTISQVPTEYLRDFIRGVFDGDGHAGKNRVSFTGNYYFIHELQYYLPLKITGIRQHNKLVDYEKSPHVLYISRTSEILKFYNYIYYSPSLFYLKRKKDKLAMFLSA